MTKPTVVIIAGGENSRFFPLNFNNYKGALTLMGKPLIVRSLENLAKHGFHQVVIVVSPKNFEGQGLSGLVAESKLDLNITFVLQPAAKGMGDAVLKARDQLPEQFIVTSGYQLNVGELADQLLAQPEENVVCCAPTTEPWEYGILKFDGNRVIGIVEKPGKGREPSNQKVQSLYALNQDFIKELVSVPESPYNFETALNLLMQKQTVGLIKMDASLPSLKYAWHLFDFQRLLFSQLRSHTSSTAQVAETAILDESLGPIYIEDGAQIGHATRIVGPAYIGRHVVIGDFSLVRGGCSIESDSTLGAYTEMVRTIMLSGSSLHQSYASDSIIGNRVKIGAGLVTANKRLDRTPVMISVKGKMVDTGRKNIGALIGDDANIGVRVSTMPGVSIGAQTQIFPGVMVYRNVDHQQTLRE